MDKNLNKFLDRMSMSEYDVPEYLFSLKESLLRGKAIDESYLIPSLYLKSIQELGKCSSTDQNHSSRVGLYYAVWNSSFEKTVH